jgi:hypothetical protein
MKNNEKCEMIYGKSGFTHVHHSPPTICAITSPTSSVFNTHSIAPAFRANIFGDVRQASACRDAATN